MGKLEKWIVFVVFRDIRKDGIDKLKKGKTFFRKPRKWREQILDSMLYGKNVA